MGASGLRYLDVGGGLGVDYDGSQTNFPSSMNYTLEEYASEVVYRVASVCAEKKVPHPTIVTESGRALAAYQSLLIVNVLGRSSLDGFEVDEDLDEIADGSGNDAAGLGPGRSPARSLGAPCCRVLSRRDPGLRAGVESLQSRLPGAG